MEQNESLYRRLQKHLDRMPVGMPATGSGVEINILRKLFTPEEAEIALNLSMLPESARKIHSRMKHPGNSPESLKKKLFDMAQKGLVMIDSKKGSATYSCAQFAIGVFEFQVDRLTPDLYREILAYKKADFADEFYRVKKPQMRTIPIGLSIEPAAAVADYDRLSTIIKNSTGPFAVANCVCRQGMRLVGSPCRRTNLMETCFMFNDAVSHYVDVLGAGRRITREETLDLLKQCEEAGLVIQPGNSQNPNFICCCCSCCCGALTMLKKFPRPAELTASNYRAYAAEHKCVTCGNCTEVCPMEAVSMHENTVFIEADRCIGCGLCIGKCAYNALSLVRREDYSRPSKKIMSLYTNILMRKIGLRRMLKLGIRMLMGLKI